MTMICGDSVDCMRDRVKCHRLLHGLLLLSLLAAYHQVASLLEGQAFQTYHSAGVNFFQGDPCTDSSEACKIFVHGVTHGPSMTVMAWTVHIAVSPMGCIGLCRIPSHQSGKLNTDNHILQFRALTGQFLVRSSPTSPIHMNEIAWHTCIG